MGYLEFLLYFIPLTPPQYPKLQFLEGSFKEVKDNLAIWGQKDYYGPFHFSSLAFVGSQLSD